MLPPVAACLPLQCDDKSTETNECESPFYGCDAFRPDIDINAAAAAARAPGLWFTSEAQVSSFVSEAVTVTDDCSDEVQTEPIQLVEACSMTEVSVRAEVGRFDYIIPGCRRPFAT